MRNLNTTQTSKSAFKRSLPALATAISLVISGNLAAAPGTLAEGPLFLSTKVQPNIFFTVDDSGSMNWEVLLTSEARTAHPGSPNSGTLDFTPDNSDEQRELCHGYNVMAYDPNRVYTPWRGVDENSFTYSNKTLTTALNNPYDNDDIDNVSNHFYYPWNDSNGDGLYQVGECDLSNSNRVDVDTLPVLQQTNYANWYTYYRKREYVAKRALSEIISNSTTRMGLSTLHNHNTVRTLVADVDDISTPVNTTAQANKFTLMRNLFRIDSANGTPLRQSLQAVGSYFEGTSGWGPSPILPASQGGECQQNFAVLMSDGVWNGNAPNVGNADTDGNTSFDGGLYADGAANVSNTLADVAMHYYERDLNTSMDNHVPTITGVDENDAQHLVTYTVAFGVTGTLPATLNPGDAGFAWPTPSSNANTTIDDMRHAAYNGRGQFLSAGDPQQLITTLNAAINDIQDRTGTAAAVSFNSTSLQTNTRLLKASFNSDRWSGDLSAFDLIIDAATNSISLSPTPAWKASTDLNSRTADSRKIVTFDGTDGIVFDWNSITSSQKDDLRTGPTGLLENEANGMARLDYIRGDHSCEQGNAGTCSYTDTGGNTFNSKIFRERLSRLGDIIHSSPAYVGPPSTPYPNDIESTPYSSFVNAKSGRAGMSYVGSNDGMLHAFDDSGVETFAFIPNILFSTANGSGLHHLTEAGYVHQYYVDLSVTVGDAFVDLDGDGTSGWQSILVGGLRGGGKGLFAIDVTDPVTQATGVSTAASKVLWEFTHDDLGYTFSDIQIAKMNNGEWAAIFGNGYNNDPLGDGTAKIFIVYLDGSNLSTPITLETGVGSIANNDCTDPGSDCNGMSSPTFVDLNGDGAIDRLYSGDVHGNLWAFDVSSGNASNWKSAYGSGAPYTPLYTACSGSPCTSSNRQPITSKPSVARHPTKRGIATTPNLLVFFGTGQYLTTSDQTSTSMQNFHGVWDSGTGGLYRDQLVTQTITDTAIGGVPVRTITDLPVDYSIKYGWKIDLTGGERSVTSSAAFGDLVFFNTLIPSSSTCSNGGSGWLMSVDILNGGTPSFPPIDVNNDGVFDNQDMVGADPAVGTRMDGIPTESRFISNKRVTADSEGSVKFDNFQPTGPDPASRMSWTGLER